MNNFSFIYPFTTENIDGYLSQFDLNDKSVLTVGSSLDQAFNSILMGANNVTVMDINPNVKDFYDLKRQIILTSKYEDFYKKVLSLDVNYSNDIFSFNDLKIMNTYLKDEESFEELKRRMENIDIQFLTANIFEMKDELREEYDYILLSNVLQYLSYYDKEDLHQKLRSIFEYFQKHLNKEGLLALTYMYNYSRIKKIGDYSLIDLINALNGYYLESYQFSSTYGDDAVITYKKTV